MKERIPYLLVLFALALCLWGCGKSAPASYPPPLVEAARLSEYEAERALPLLEALADSLDRLDEEGRVYYDLLRVRVNDKLNIRATSDSLIRRVTAFYERYGDPDKLTLAYYYRGRVCSDLNDALQAVEYYRKAIEASKGTKQYLLLSKIYSQLGEALEYQNIYEEAIPYYRKAYDYTLLSKDSVTLSLPIRDIAAIYNALGKNDSALIYYKKAYETAIITRNRPRALEILVEMSAAYRDLGDFPNAFAPLFVSLEDSVDRNMNPTYYSLGKLYLLTGKLDSADYWMNRVRLGDDVYIDSEVYNYLGQIKLLRKDYERSAYYYSLYQQRQDSIAKIDDSEEIRRMKSLYDYNLQKQENKRLEMKNEQGKVIIFQILSVGFSILSLLGFLLVLSERKKKRLENKIENLRQEQYRKSLEYIEKNQQKIQELEDSLRKARQESASPEAQSLIALDKGVLEASTRVAELSQEKRKLMEKGLAESKIYAKFHDSSAKIEEEDWKELRCEIDKRYDMTNRLIALCPKLSQLELRVCYLVKIHVKATDMSRLLDHSLTGISSIRYRLYAKLTGEKGSAKKLDKFILDL